MDTKQKLIVLSQRVDQDNAYHERRDALDQRWSDLLSQCDLLAVPLANQPDMLPAVLERLSPDGIILTGGGSPVVYGGAAPERDACDEALITYACKKNIPLLGVCRGLQSIILYFGGTLKTVDGHRATRHLLQRTEENMVQWRNTDNGHLKNADNDQPRSMVNSYHELAADELGTQLLPIFLAEDGTIEAIKHKTLPICAIMWHPERETPFCWQDIDLIKKWFNG